MKYAYPIILTPVKEGGYAVKVPDLDIYTQGKNVAEAIYMARDAIGMWICYEQDEEKTIPNPSDITAITSESDEIKTLVDIDADEYRRAHDNRTIRKNLTLPSWLNDRAEKAGINFSQTLQSALKKQLNIMDHPHRNIKKQP
ncbi:type II toxin-antitoxin system HicB family antitoxin [Dehalobacterium formicoaceticum]|uniref:Type II toxin-antitoxin system HicB family antitoxin n=1 Tax=Dehalobacterium formicoaceticum TaxID=51515 RepID=A0ABT1Y226_9FIRM|nr:type II toxin-antitoxin system HicB family antitoxin [Dehalobacterium formicoaceticum]